jgi:hypothetical protein
MAGEIYGRLIPPLNEQPVERDGKLYWIIYYDSNGSQPENACSNREKPLLASEYEKPEFESNMCCTKTGPIKVYFTRKKEVPEEGGEGHAMSKTLRCEDGVSVTISKGT